MGCKTEISGFDHAYRRARQAGLWQDVILTFEAAENDGQKLNVIYFTAAIAALTRSKQPERALQLSVLLQQRDLKADVFAYTALIDACSKGGQWQVALQLLHAMQQQGVAPNLRTYTAAIDACSKGGQWQKADALLREMLVKGIKPDVKIFSATIDAYSQVGQWQEAIDLLREMQQQNVAADLLSYNCAMIACQKGGKWQLAVELLQEVTAAGLQPNSITYICVIDALHAAHQHSEAEAMYLEMHQRGLTVSHWSAREKHSLDFHDFSEGMAAAAMRIVLREMVSQQAVAQADSSSSSATSNAPTVHVAANDLYIITGHGTGEGKQGSVLQPLVTSMLKQLNIECYVDPTNKGRLIARSSSLQHYKRNVTVCQST
jgi:pentatricopeptide repeat protein